MPELDEMKISDLTTAPAVADNTLLETSVEDTNNPGTYDSYKATLYAIFDKILNSTQFTQRLPNFINQTIFGAINELNDNKNIAVLFSTADTYAVGDYVIYNGTLYKCISAVSTAGAWDSSKWSSVVVTDEMGSGGGGSSTLAGLTDVNLTTPTDGQALIYDGTNQEWVNGSGGGGGDANMTELTQAEYDALEQAGQLIPDMMYFITDGQSGGGVVIDDTTTSANKVWSSDKTNTEIQTKQDDLEGGGLSDVNLNTLVTNMNYWVTRTDIINAPVDSYGYLEVIRVNTTETAYIVMQRFTRFGNDTATTRGETYLRFFSNNQWYNWFKVAELMT